ncbi:hypothetical protein DRJ25_01555 [Candidatus Woesearchaeota archaeon]|nr:MAG: hypothetical protein DRJ25_01555 [Candidatus Woesearchaeota archaeon]
MTEGSKRLIIYGFIKSQYKSLYPKTPEERRKLIRKWEKDIKSKDEAKKKIAEKKLKDLQNHADHEEQEFSKYQVMLLDRPKPLNTWSITIESQNNSVEPYYYFCMHELADWGYNHVDKIIDVFTAAEHSSFYGAAAQKLGLAQDKVGQYLATIGKMIKDMFQLVRELRWIDERIRYYEDSDSKDKKKSDIALTALKGLWVDLVDGVVGGQRTGSNLFTMAQQLQFSALPDLFFDIHPRTVEEIEKVVEEQAGEFNKTVKRVLKRKLYNFLTWKASTYREIINRRKFTIRYLRQHYNVIKMYIGWCKPYIRHIERLRGSDSRLNSADVISAFESSMIEIEVLGRSLPKDNKKVYNCMMISFEYKTKPSMQYQTEGYHRGPIHIGITNIQWRAYAWTAEQIENYKRMREEEDLDMLKSIDDSLKDAMESLGDDLLKYLKEAEESIEEPEKEEEVKKPKGLGDIFKETFAGFFPKNKTKPKKPKKPSKKELALAKEKEKEEQGAAGWLAKLFCFKVYEIVKKAHGMLAW